MGTSLSFTNRHTFRRRSLIVLLIGGLGLSLWGIPVHLVYAATFDVDRSDDDPAATACTAAPNDCSLRGAISAAAASAGPDTINLPAETYTLVGSELTLDSDISLVGAGAASTIIQADVNPGVATYRVIFMQNGTVTLSGVTIRHGQASDGGGIYINDGNLTLTDGTVVSGNTATGDGGGIFNYDHLLVTGGASVSGNTAAGDGGGIASLASSVAITDGATVSGNVSDSCGGGIFDFYGGLSLQSGAVVSNNVAGFGGGICGSMTGISITDAAVRDNNASGNGGGITYYGYDTEVRLQNAVVAGNHSANGNGGGLSTRGDNLIRITDSMVTENTAPNGFGGGAALTDGRVVITSSTFTGNHGGNGGGMMINTSGWSTSHISNSTISSNSAAGSGGGIYYQEVSLRLTNVTITGNTADSDNSGDGNGGGLFFESGPDVGNTIIAGNADLSGGSVDCASSGAVMNSLDHNLIGDPTGCPIGGTTTHNITDADPLLGALQDNGGSTTTHLLLAGSPAIDTGDNAMCAAEPIYNRDQRGMARPFDGNGDGTPQCDIGAVEIQTVATQPVFSINDVTVIEGDTGIVDAIFTVTRSGFTDVTSTVDYITADDTATVTGSDYVAASGELTFDPGMTTQTIAITVNGDTLDEGISEQFVVNLSNPTNATIQKEQGIGTILDDDGAEGEPSAEDHARAQAPLCSLIGGGTNSIVRADVSDGTVSEGSVFCRIITQNGIYVIGPEELGNPDVIALGVIQAVDVFGLKHDGTAEPHFNAAVKVCLQGAGRLLYLDATTYPRTLSGLPITSEFGYTCGLIFNAGTVVLVP